MPFAEHVAVADLDAARLPAELEVLRHEPDRAEREEAVALAHARVAVDHHVRVEHRRPRPRRTLSPTTQKGPTRTPGSSTAPAATRAQGVDVGRGHASPPGAGAAPRPRARRPPAPRPWKRTRSPRRWTRRTSRRSWSPGTTGRRNFASSKPTTRISTAARVGSGLEQPDAGGLGERLQDQHPRHHRRAREVAGEEVLGPGHVLDRHQPPRRVVLEDPVHEHERVLGGNLADEPSDLAGAHAGRGPRRVRARRRGNGPLPRRPAPGGERPTAWGSPAPAPARRPPRAWPSRPRRPSR